MLRAGAAGSAACTQQMQFLPADKLHHTVSSWQMLLCMSAAVAPNKADCFAVAGASPVTLQLAVMCCCVTPVTSNDMQQPTFTTGSSM